MPPPETCLDRESWILSPKWRCSKSDASGVYSKLQFSWLQQGTAYLIPEEGQACNAKLCLISAKNETLYKLKQK